VDYIPRIVDDELGDRLRAMPIVVIEGARACGKTETATRVAQSVVRLDIDPAARQLADLDPGLLLDGPVPRLLDEWQVEPTLWNHARHEADRRGLPGQFVLTGSAVPSEDPQRHSGAGRFSFLRMRPLTLFETGVGTGDVSLRALLDGDSARGKQTRLTLGQLSELIVKGGWPAQQRARSSDAARAARDYLQQIRDVDVQRVTGGRRDPMRVGRLLVSLARNVATEVSISTLARDSEPGGEELARNTVAAYLDVLQRIMVLEDLPAWAPHLRSKTPLRQTPKRHFVDPSLAAAALGAGPSRLEHDLQMLGLLFESLVVRDLRVLAQPLDGQVLHYRDAQGREVDTIVQLADGRWGAFEVKLGGEAAIEGAAASLRRFASSIDTRRTGEPSSLGIICMSGYAYTRPDGVAVVPIGSLAP
jgi:predicted AAA+ superfamily ATPase